MARPRASDDERRSECFAIRLTPAERIALIAEAERLSISPTSLARQRLLRGRVVVQEHRRLDPRQAFELGRIGVNLNQIARALNSQQSINPATIEVALGELRGVLAAMLLSPGPDAGTGISVGDVGASAPVATLPPRIGDGDKARAGDAVPPQKGDGGKAPAGEADPAPTRPGVAPHQTKPPPAVRR